MTNSVFEGMTNLYSLSKTLRFELKPVGKTRENMDDNLEYDKDLQTFLKDQSIEDAYQVLKPVFDTIHEDFITQSLESEEGKKIDIAEYYTLTHKLLLLKSKKANLKKREQSDEITKEIENIQKEIDNLEKDK